MRQVALEDRFEREIGGSAYPADQARLMRSVRRQRFGPNFRRDEESVMLSATVKEAVADVHTETPQEERREAAPGPP